LCHFSDKKRKNEESKKGKEKTRWKEIGKIEGMTKKRNTAG